MPRYEIRDLPQAEPNRKAGFQFGLFDTFTQEFVVGGGHFKERRVADTQARLYNEAYERTLR